MNMKERNIQKMWNRIELPIHPHKYLTSEDECYYALEYKVGGGFSISAENQLILNLKILDNQENRLYHRSVSIREFIIALTEILPDGATVMFIPTSKREGDEDYNSRWLIIEDWLKRYNAPLRIVTPIKIKESGEAAHFGGERNPDIIKQKYKWQGFAPPYPEEIFVIDDVITSGGHFKACKSVILDHLPDINVIGIFWARSVQDW